MHSLPMKRSHDDHDDRDRAPSPANRLRIALDDLCCPITHHLMVHPAVAADGHTYERAAIRRWLLSSRMNSPMTNEAMENRVLRANHALRRICDAAMSRTSHAGRVEAEDAANSAAVLDDRQLERLCANVAACEAHRGCARRWAFAMDGDSPEDVARMLVASLGSERKTPDQTHHGLVALQRVASVSRADAAAAGTAQCALGCLNRTDDERNVEAALRLIAIVGGGSQPADALAAVQRELRRPSGLAALAALLPDCDAAQLEGCAAGLLEGLTSAVPAVASAAMRPAAVLATRVGACPRLRDAMAAAMLRFHADESVQVAALRALREQAELTPAPRRTLELLGFALSTQLMRTQAASGRSVRDAATALCTALGVMVVAPPPVALALERGVSDGSEASESDESDEDGSSSMAEWDDHEEEYA